MKMAYNEKKKLSNRKYDVKTYDQIMFKTRKEDMLRELIAMAAKKTGVTSGEYMRRAICNSLKADGIDTGVIKCKENVNENER